MTEDEKKSAMDAALETFKETTAAALDGAIRTRYGAVSMALCPSREALPMLFSRVCVEVLGMEPDDTVHGSRGAIAAFPEAIFPLWIAVGFGAGGAVKAGYGRTIAAALFSLIVGGDALDAREAEKKGRIQ